MNQEDLFKKIGLILIELNNQYEFLAQNPQQLSELELALFHANADFLSDHAKILIKIKNNEVPLEIRAAEENPTQVDLIQGEDRTEELESEYYGDSLQEEQQVEQITFAEEISEREEELFKLDDTPASFEFILNEGKAEEKFDFEEKSVDELFNRPLSQEEENILAQKRRLADSPPAVRIDSDDDEIGPEPFLVSKPATEEFVISEEDLDLKIAIEPIINTTHTAIEDPTYQPTLNDLLAGKTDRSVNSHSVAQGITDLKQGINLNDKLLYIKDLFNGYNLAYAEAIDLANKLPNFEAADNFFKKNYATQYNWKEKQTTVDKFYALLNQRFK